MERAGKAASIEYFDGGIKSATPTTLDRIHFPLDLETHRNAIAEAPPRQHVIRIDSGVCRPVCGGMDIFHPHGATSRAIFAQRLAGLAFSRTWYLFCLVLDSWRSDTRDEDLENPGNRYRWEAGDGVARDCQILARMAIDFPGPRAGMVGRSRKRNVAFNPVRQRRDLGDSHLPGPGTPISS